MERTMKQLIAIAAVMSTSTLALGQVVFDNFGENDLRSTVDAWNSFGPDSWFPFELQQAETFSSDISGSIATIELGLAAFSATENKFSVSVYSDAGGVPGTALWDSGVLVDYAPVDNFDVLPPVVIDLNGELDIVAGADYWVVVSAFEDGAVSWYTNVVGDLRPHMVSSDGGPWSQGTFLDDVASTFRVTLVPAPGALGVFAMGSLFATRRRRA